jgi:transposase
MSEHSVSEQNLTVGLDVGDRFSSVCVLDGDGQVQEEGRVRTTPEGLARWLAGRPACRIALEVGTQSSWIHHLLSGHGHDVVVANARKVRAIYDNPDKSDRVDAEQLARLARADKQLLRPIQVRDLETQATRSLLRSRDVLVRSRTKLINHVRSSAKVFGLRLPACSSQAAASKVRGLIPPQLREALEPVLDVIAELCARIKSLNLRIKQVAETRYPQTKILEQVTGVGSLTALAYVVTIVDPRRFASSRKVGSYLGLRPGRYQSGRSDPQLRITKAGDRHLRRLLVTSAHYILGPFGPDCDLRRYGLRLASRGGGKIAKKKAIVAVARKLAVLLHRLWSTGEVYQPLCNQPTAAPTA